MSKLYILNYKLLMLYFSKLQALHKHIIFLQKKLKQDYVFLVGGCVRDLLLGITDEPTDIDVTLAADPNELYTKIDKKKISHFMTEKFGTITLIPKEQKSKLQYELTPFREELNYTDKRHPEEIIWSKELVLDAKRRDFTINCLYYFAVPEKFCRLAPKAKTTSIIDKKELKKQLEQGSTLLPEYQLAIIQDHELIMRFFPWGKFDTTAFQKHFGEENIHHIIIDPYQGIQALVNWRLEAVGDPDARFEEDALRLIRALRFVNVLNTKLEVLHHDVNKLDSVRYFDIEKDTWKSIQKHFYLVQYMASERIKIELDKVFEKGNPFGFIALLDETNMLKYIFPAIYNTKHVDQPIRYHPFDTYHHTLLTLYHVQQISTNPLVRYAMLYHDVGKVDQYYLYTLGLDREEIRKLGHLNHRNTSSQIAKKDFRVLGFGNKAVEEIMRYINNHHRPEEILASKPDRQIKKLRKMLSEAGIERMRNLFDVVMGDRLWHYNPVQPPETDEIIYLKQLTENLQDQEWQFTSKELAIDGNIIMHYFSLKSWKQVGELLQNAFDRVIDNIKNRNSQEKILSYLKKTLKNTKK